MLSQSVVKVEKDEININKKETYASSIYDFKCQSDPVETPTIDYIRQDLNTLMKNGITMK